MNYEYFPNVDPYYFTKIIFIDITTKFIRNFFKYWEAVKLMVIDTSIPKTWNFLKSLKFSLATHTVSVFLDRITLSTFEQMIDIPVLIITVSLQ